MTLSQSRSCPTRIDGQVSLFAHNIGVARCQELQRGCFHKCYTCEWSNAQQARLAQSRPKVARRSRESVVGSQAAIPESLPELPAEAVEVAAPKFVLSMTE